MRLIVIRKSSLKEPDVLNPIPGPSDAVHLLYRAHHGWLRGWLGSRLGNACDAADLAQDTFVRVLRHRHEVGALREPRAYLTTVAGRLLINHHRRRSVEQAYFEALALLPDQAAPSAEQRAIVLQALQDIDDMLAGLSAPVRQAFLMAQLEGRSHHEIAARLKVSPRSVRRYVAKGLEQCIMAAA